jgi:predicted TIM-barrel fold metal-dependent hydrolase
MESRIERQRLKDLLVVDCDVHIHESPKALIPYCEMPWRVALETIQDVPERYNDSFLSPGGGFEAVFPTGHETTRKVTEPEQMRADLDAIGVNIGVLFPDQFLVLPLLTQPEYAGALARAYNLWILDRWVSPQRGLLGTLIAWPQDPVAAAVEIRLHAGNPGIIGVYLPCAGVDPLWGHRRYDPIFQAAQETDLPVLLHSVGLTHPVFPFNNQGFDTEMARHAISHPFSIIANLVHMVTTGVPVRFPGLRIATFEAGISWIPFVMQRLDKEYVEKRRQVPFLTERPSHYLKTHVWYATQPIEEPEDMAEVADMIRLYHGEDNTLFASDWPHHDFDHPSKLFQVPLSADVRRKVFGENALRLFKIDASGRRVNGLHSDANANTGS